MTVPLRPLYVIKSFKGDLQVVLTDGQSVTLHAGFAAPPGSPIEGTLLGTSHSVRLKVHGCRRVAATELADGPFDDLTRRNIEPQRFEINGRWVNLSREARLTLLGEMEST